MSASLCVTTPHGFLGSENAFIGTASPDILFDSSKLTAVPAFISPPVALYACILTVPAPFAPKGLPPKPLRPFRKCLMSLDNAALGLNSSPGVTSP